MRQKYPRFRHAQRAGGPYRKDRRLPEKETPFAMTVIISCVWVAVGTWFAVPHVQRAWQLLTLSSHEIAVVEASVHYGGCNEARAAGAAPINAGSPGYRIGMDGDVDGVACE
ncbi:excalibur calcium-binding domain-containing protein [Sphingomonas sp. Leaf339]|uniref:excalibur calcium-binding domain-containing protein n=1 Tax=Sphingomonas sp. Leaf339 TaxID=1736343 RepID=UPI0009E6E4E7|nr:excalibur calcium-binding domain-containing protein [Sphingomonas sp. Leaf339]